MTLIGLINDHRATLNLEPVQYDKQLTRCARGHSRHHYEDGHFEGHVNPEGQSFEQRMAMCGIDIELSGENLAYNMILPQTVFTQWMNTPADRANIERMCFVRIGVGKHQEAWTANFAR
ncbi:MAG TPA: CAP domain-containing protein [Planctomycetota bacterium]|nr:CAP domain-containing protein [Planctomycetota bacterium]